MLRVLTPFVILHFAALFSLLAFLCVLAGDDGVSRAFRFMGLIYGENTAIRILGVSEASVLALAFAVCAVLFWWALLETLAGDGAQRANQALDLAFSGAVATLTVVSLLGAAHDVAGLVPAIGIHLAALLVSYSALALIGRATLPGRIDETAVAGERNRVGEAALAASLIRLSARNSATGSD